jgi:aspartyl-tRNA(Asn)/glutamyl-tRNA(Gln) amidotransferase subunit B
MEKGAMRGEANVSLRCRGADELGTKVEVKNLNSFRAVKQALDYEIARQAHVLDLGEQVRQVTMGWDERRGRTVEQRSKEESDDYRYFPEPDLPPLRVSRDWVTAIAATLPLLPDDRQDRFISGYGLSRSDASVLASDRQVADYFEAAVTAGQEEGIAPDTTANWVMGELFRLLKAGGVEIQNAKVAPSALADLIASVEKGTITSGSGRKVLAEMFATGRPAGEIIEEKQLAQISDQDALAEIVEEVLAAHPSEVAQFRGGKETLLQWFVGQVMRATRGKANPQMVRDLLKDGLER